MIADAVAHDYLAWPNVETVTVRTRRDDETVLSDEIAYAMRENVSRGRAGLANEEILGDLLRWNIPAVLMTQIGDIQPGDVIIEGSEVNADGSENVWIIEQCQKVRFGSQWLCDAIKPTLRHKVDIYGPVVTRKTDAHPSESFGVEKVRVSCWVRPVSPKTALTYGQEGDDLTHLLYFSSDPEVDTRHYALFGTRKLAFTAHARDVDGLGRLWLAPALENR